MLTVMPLKLAVATSISQLVQSEATLITTNHDIVRAPEGSLDLTLLSAHWPQSSITSRVHASSARGSLVVSHLSTAWSNIDQHQ